MRYSTSQFLPATLGASELALVEELALVLVQVLDGGLDEQLRIRANGSLCVLLYRRHNNTEGLH